MKRTWFYAEVQHGQIIPHAWLGLAWRRYVTDSSVYLPIPFNVLARWAYRLYFVVRFPCEDAADVRACAIYWRGYRDAEAAEANRQACYAEAELKRASG